MRIEKISLLNFGSYEGIAEFELDDNNSKNIILIGGKNGAGKTTLFTAMRVCLYGYLSMGYRNYNSYYTRAIIKLINNAAKLNKPTSSSVTMHFSISNGREYDNYKIERRWTLSNTLTERFLVTKNEVDLTNSEINDFEKFINNLIPPELFNLYFFDGEKIADFFLEDGGNIRIKNAFLTLCGYDTFEIMNKQFKRLNTLNSNSSPNMLVYIKKRQDLNNASIEHGNLKKELDKCLDNIEKCDSEIKFIEHQYEKSGGVSEDYWNNKVAELKEEERKREELNSFIKKEANDTIPFLLIRTSLDDLLAQILNEEKNQKFINFKEILSHPEIKMLISNDETFDAIEKTGNRLFSKCDKAILDLSMEEKAVVISQINKIINCDKEKIIKAKIQIKRSINKSSRIRKEMEKSSIEFVKYYMTSKTTLLEKKADLLNEQIKLESAVRKSEDKFNNLEVEISNLRKILEDELKKKSISDISAKSILMLEKLQSILYHKQIRRVEDYFRRDINLLMRKSKFIDDIEIDDDFNIHIFRFECVKPDVLINMLNESDEKINAFTLKYLKKKFNVDEIKKVISYLKNEENEITFPVEIDKTLLSNGEKQIFIMALYHSLVQLSDSEIPFVIDTPFARIDKEHRNNISKYFFRELKGQVFILSTNEEIEDEHIKLLEDKIAYTYTLENNDNKKTKILKGTYFEVKNGI